ncbi:glycosyltransferase family 4 protein [Mucilaginibacter phyllosphaerae]|uniref:Glycosyltransferase n=1 Tax=Mucilaginibacter phyllosphaerae TaxID=1812349 RepID=A0A4Y8ABD3_9SPHI|nr:glycosyltransferase family 4 protein [Mucilaginibacter phyllosphaerae]MBB3969840.1 glycosyltransferase involved in cell wall biosynthesis [Mucilaginibacter phyllosphaerae]TEW65215.1 glycosyltransferase [Mucilaginibacter phyllosphaerae]GGH17230.1 glycosyl transferase [Mucilaginibacter phyllosphaerae]
MKVALINTSDAGGGAAEACMRLLKALQLQQVDVTMVVQHKKRADDAVYTVEKNFFGKMRSSLNFLMERIPFMLFQERDKLVRFAFSPADAGTDISRSKVIREADIIHLHWTNSGFLSIKDLKKIFALNKPIVWTLHDMWAFTGGCHYAGPCNHFKNQCGNCYFLRNPEDNDLSHDGWLRKKNMLGVAKSLSVVTCSHWLGEVAMKSTLLKGLMIQAIPNPIDTELFSPKDKIAARAKWGANPSAKIILFGAANINDRRKGISYLVDALHILKNKYTEDTPMEIVIFGKNKHFDVTTLPFPVQQLNMITSPADLAEIYSMADVFVSPSIEDNLPNMIMEAMSCGTPVAAFNTGGIPDLIDHLVNGYMAEFKSSADLAAGINYVLNTANHNKYGSAARYKVKRMFNNEKVAGQYIDLYKSIV